MGVSGISDEDAAKIISHLETLQANRNVSQEIAAALAEVLPVSSLAPPGVADARISLDKKSLRVVKGFGRSIVFSLAVDTRYEWSLNKPSPQQSLRTFSCDKRLRPINEWVSDEAATIEHELNYCVKDIARQINKVLTEQPPASDNRFPELDV